MSINKKELFLLISLNVINIWFISSWDKLLSKFRYFWKFFNFKTFKNIKKEIFWKNFLANGSDGSDSSKDSRGKKINLIILTIKYFCISIILLFFI